MSEELYWLCNGDVWIFKLWFVLFYIYNLDVTFTLYINWTVFYINIISMQSFTELNWKKDLIPFSQFKSVCNIWQNVSSQHNQKTYLF